MVNIEQLQRRTQRYEFADGVRDIQFGLYYLTYGLSFWIIFDLPHVWLPALVDFRRTQGEVLTTLLVCLLIAGPPLLVNMGSLALMNEFVRRRWLWRETGFIKPRQWIVPRRVIYVGLTISLSAFIGVALLAIQLSQPWLVMRGLFLGIGLSYAYMLAGVGARLDIPRYRWIGVVGAAASLAIVLLPFSMGIVGLIMGGFWGVLLIGSGLYAMRRTASTQQGVSYAA